jgi:hypothetical protein
MDVQSGDADEADTTADDGADAVSESAETSGSSIAEAVRSFSGCDCMALMELLSRLLAPPDPPSATKAGAFTAESGGAWRDEGELEAMKTAGGDGTELARSSRA